MSEEFDSIPDFENEDKPDEMDTLPANAPRRQMAMSKGKYMLDEMNTTKDCEEGGYFPRGVNGAIAPSVAEERALRLKHTAPKPKVTLREAFQDEEAEAILDYRQGSSTAIAPAVENPLDVEIAPLRKEKPALKEKKKTTKAKRGETLTTEHAIEFMIKERQAMDEEYAVLRRENDELRARVSAQLHISPNKGEGGGGTDGGKDRPIVVEKIVEQHVTDPPESHWKKDAERLRRENDELRAQHAAREVTIRLQKELAVEAQQRRLPQLSPADRGEVETVARGLEGRHGDHVGSVYYNDDGAEGGGSSNHSDTDNAESSSCSVSSSSERDDPGGQRSDPCRDQFSSVRSRHPKKKPSKPARQRRGNKRHNAETLVVEHAPPARSKKKQGVPRLDLSAMSPPDHPPPQQHHHHQAVPAQRHTSESGRDSRGAVPKPSSSVLQQTGASKYSGLPMLLWKGDILWKVPFNGRGLPERRLVMIKRASSPGPHAKPVQVLSAGASQDTTGAPVAYIIYPPTLVWANPDKPDDLSNARELSLFEGAHLVEGHKSTAFWKSKSRGERCAVCKAVHSIVIIVIIADCAGHCVFVRRQSSPSREALLFSCYQHAQFRPSGGECKPSGGLEGGHTHSSNRYVLQ